MHRSAAPHVTADSACILQAPYKMPEGGDQTVASDLRAAFEDAFLEHRVSCILGSQMQMA
jgi:hypothetical protein